MLRRLALAVALSVVAAGSAYAAACLPIGAGPVLNGFETTGTTCTNDFGEWTISSTPAGATWGVSSGSLTPLQGQSYGWAAKDGTQISITLTAAACPVLAANADWATPHYDYLFAAYASTTVSANEFHFEFQLINTTTATATGFTTAAVLAGSATPPWTYVITSLNYAQNIGYNLSDITQIRMVDFGPLFNENLGIGYDDLQIDTVAGVGDTPNSPMAPGAVTVGNGTCGGQVSLEWNTQSPTGTDAINGYHIYRSTISATGPWTSAGYVLASSAAGTTPNFTFSDTPVFSPGPAGNAYYEILPYSSTTTNFGGGGSNGVYTGCNVVSLDEPWTAADGGVNESLLNPADVVTVNDAAACSPTDTPSFSPSVSPSATQTLTLTSTPTSSATPTSTPSYTATVTFTHSPTPSATPTYTTPTATFTAVNTPVNTPTLANTVTLANTPAPTNTAVNTNTPGPTNTPVNTPTPVATVPYVQLYPNPFYPDRGQVSHLGPVPAGETWSVFDIIGKFVYKATTTGNPALDVWYGYNADGMECATGIYFMVIRGKIYRIGLVRN